MTKKEVGDILQRIGGIIFVGSMITLIFFLVISVLYLMFTEAFEFMTNIDIHRIYIQPWLYKFFKGILP